MAAKIPPLVTPLRWYLWSWRWERRTWLLIKLLTRRKGPKWSAPLAGLLAKTQLIVTAIVIRTRPVITRLTITAVRPITGQPLVMTKTHRRTVPSSRIIILPATSPGRRPIITIVVIVTRLIAPGAVVPGRLLTSRLERPLAMINKEVLGYHV